MAHDLDTKNKFLQLRAVKGWSYDKIAKRLGVSKQTLINWSRELHTELSNRRNAALHELQQKYQNTVEKRIKLFGEPLQRVQKELEKRDLSEVSTPELARMFLSLAAALKKEQTVLRFRKEESLAKKILDKDTFVDQWPG